MVTHPLWPTLSREAGRRRAENAATLAAFRRRDVAPNVAPRRHTARGTKRGMSSEVRRGRPGRAAERAGLGARKPQASPSEPEAGGATATTRQPSRLPRSAGASRPSTRVQREGPSRPRGAHVRREEHVGGARRAHPGCTAGQPRAPSRRDRLRRPQPASRSPSRALAVQASGGVGANPLAGVGTSLERKLEASGGGCGGGGLPRG